MKRQTTALLLHELGDSLGPLKLALEGQAMEVCWMRNCQEAATLLLGANPPHLVFTEINLPDGTWEDIVTLAVKAPKAVNVIVVSRLADVKFYLKTIVSGAFDFIVPPLSGDELAHVVRCAAENASCRREVQALPA
jgi:DNA-binding NtrC family response regulator